MARLLDRRLTDRTFEAVVFHWHVTGARASGRAASLRRRVEALCGAGVDVAIVHEGDVDSLDGTLRARPSGPGRLWLCVEGGTRLFQVRHDRPRATESCAAGAVRTVFARLAERGIGPGLVLVIDHQTAPVRATTPAVLRRVLDEQLRRRRRRRVPAIDPDPAWTISEVSGDPLRRRVTEALFTLSSGGLGTRGSVEESEAGSVPMVLVAGIYTGVGAQQHLLPGPQWTALDLRPAPRTDVRTLDLRTGVLVREESAAAVPLRTLRFASIHRPGVVALRAEAGVGRLRPGPALRPPPPGMVDGVTRTGRLGEREWARVTGGPAGIAAVAAQRLGQDREVRTVERVAAYTADPCRQPLLRDALAAVDAAERRGFDRLLAEQREAWAERWDAVDVSIPDDPAAQLAVRFALFHLWSAVDRRDEVAVGARGVSGPGYRGHVFWDTEVFVLPAVVSMDHAAARALLAYRLHRLAAARRRAQATGHRGARLPWESAATGDDVTPESILVGREVVPITTGRWEEHITADIAWATAYYASWSGDHEFETGPGLPLVTEGARYWASRCRVDAAGRAHIDSVIGPDEYHESVDDNAFTNVMARWHLRRAADLVGETSSGRTEAEHWRDLAARLVDGYDPHTRRYEQFRGYYQLEPLTVAQIAEPPVAADLLLGHDRLAQTQIIKQPDVLMLHHLVPEETAAGSLAANLDFYGPRTAHGSSLSPAITAALLARAGRPDEALPLLRTALRLDLDDLTGTTASGLHMATFGGVWQAFLLGFAGVRVRHGVVNLDPRLPPRWRSLGLRFRCLGSRVRLDITADGVSVWTDRPLRVQLCAGKVHPVSGHVHLPVETG